MQEQSKIYGDQNLVNLVNHKGHEKPVKEAFEKYIEKVRIFIGVRQNTIITKLNYRYNIPKSNMIISTSIQNAKACVGIVSAFSSNASNKTSYEMGSSYVLPHLDSTIASLGSLSSH